MRLQIYSSKFCKFHILKGTLVLGNDQKSVITNASIQNEIFASKNQKSNDVLTKFVA